MVEFNLSERQQTTVAAAVTLLCATFILFFLMSLFWAMGAMAVRFSNVLLPLLTAAVLALILKPYHQWLTDRLRGRTLVAVLLVYVSVLLPLTVLVVIFGGKVAGELADFIMSIPGWGTRVLERLEQHLPAIQQVWDEHELQGKLAIALEENAATIAGSLTDFGYFVGGAIGGLFAGVAGLLGWVVLPVYLAFFLMAKPLKRAQLEGLLPFLKASTREDVIYLGEQFVSIVIAFFRGQLLIGLAQGVLYAIGFMIVGLQYGLTLGMALGMLNIIPYLGSMVGLSIALPLAFLQDGGGVMQVVYVVIVFTTVQCIEGYYLTPKIMGDRTGLHPLIIIVAIFFWGSVFGGITGMVLAIPLTAFLVVFWRLAKTKYIHEIV